MHSVKTGNATDMMKYMIPLWLSFPPFLLPFALPVFSIARFCVLAKISVGRALLPIWRVDSNVLIVLFDIGGVTSKLPENGDACEITFFSLDRFTGQRHLINFLRHFDTFGVPCLKCPFDAMLLSLVRIKTI